MTTASADWELAIPPPAGMRHPNPGEIDQIIEESRKSTRVHPTCLRSTGISDFDRHSVCIYMQGWNRAVMKLTDSVIRHRKIYIEGMWPIWFGQSAPRP